LLAAAISDVNAGHLDSAMATCHRLLQNEPRSPSVHQLLAVIFLQRQDVQSACRHIALSLAERPHHVMSLLIAGRAARMAGDVTAALRHFELAASLAPDSAEPAFLVGSTLLDLGHPSAANVLRRLVDLHPRHGDGWCTLGLALKKDRDLKGALDAFTRAIEISPDIAKAYFYRGAISHELEKFEDATAAFQRAQELDPGATEITFNLGLSLYREGRLGDAQAAFERAVSTAPAFADAWFNMGLVCQDRHDFTGAATAFRNALTHRPDYAEAAVNLGIVLQESGSMNEAIDAYRHAFKLRPDAFGRIAHALTAPSTGQMWLDLNALRSFLHA
jgi:tetratricopeptide (TPR) repeat protein